MVSRRHTATNWLIASGAALTILGGCSAVPWPASDRGDAAGLTGPGWVTVTSWTPVSRSRRDEIVAEDFAAAIAELVPALDDRPIAIEGESAFLDQLTLALLLHDVAVRPWGATSVPMLHRADTRDDVTEYVVRIGDVEWRCAYRTGRGIVEPLDTMTITHLADAYQPWFE